MPGRMIESTPRAATGPANDTRPATTARTTAPGGAARSTPRCPGPYGPAGGSKPRTITGRCCPACRTGQVPTGSPAQATAPVLTQPAHPNTAAASARATGAALVFCATHLMP
ncbi:hypothetical protein [Streptomyces sp. SCSIO 30461]|uniref:hypothetical protein n=1 Tax=Streptomyces sp. SCSIO 30461 TaxID=3118085 RepID=UPI00387ED03F